VTLTAGNVIHVLDLVGTASFAFSGALRALHHRPDFIGLTVLAGATAIGGGVFRDVVLNRDVTMLGDLTYPVVILAAALVAFVAAGWLKRHETFFKYFDAVGLGVFSGIGASIAWAEGFNPLSILFIAAITGAGGGVIRDVLLSEVPLVLYREVYVTAVLLGAMGLMVARELGANELAGFLIAMVVTTGVRMLAIHYNWSLPRIAPPGGAGGHSDIL